VLGKPVVDYCLIIGVGPQAPEPIEHVATTAIEAEAHPTRLRRLCGKSGKVEVWAKDGRKISPDRLDSLVRAEKAKMSPS
jgi:hypothetical protein